MQVKTVKELKTKKYDIFHPTYYSDYYLKIVEEFKIPFVITIYDMIHEKFSKLFHNIDEVILNKKKLCKLATKIITISESTKNDLIKFYDIQNSKIVVIHLGNDWGTASLLNHRKEYILFVGDRWNYKNFLPFLKSISNLLLKYDFELICAGSSDFNKIELDLILELGIQDHVKHRKLINLNELKSLYRNAKIFVFPSLYEGFGLPILEAQSQNTPIVCSNTSSFPEVAGEGALFFDPISIDSMSQIITEVIFDNKLQKQLISKGNENIKKFNWNETSKKTNALYEFINNK